MRHDVYIAFLRTSAAALIMVLFLALPVTAQTQDEPEEEERNTARRSELWNGFYTKYKIGKKLFYYGEYHIRTRDQLVQNMGQIYLRFGLSYIINKNLEITGGIVTPFYWAPPQYQEQERPYDKVVNQFRFWQQALFIVPLGKAKIYHQLRAEQRWRRDYYVGSPFELTFRWRYKISTYIPLNSYKFQPGTYFLSAYNEVFIQTGKTIIRNPFEDNRLFLGMGYILNDKVQFQVGYAKSWQQRSSGIDYVNRDLIRLSVYHNLDFTKKKSPPVDFQPIF
ncbi:DUF2490 domain-containing protein [Algoriphagus sediminis]|uniref:DUF2490 domain-containing protein n=1 Tax=Algoriphagus sediminis TaxID=3057113 RepID=A0ABT7YCD9_9BACT|nr:DUF2490 domain-containing protein [Algoriphagus sediminis]MDN3204060.1 DUF2490 domain-containing protein [Algoriphagus sediminis]